MRLGHLGKALWPLLALTLAGCAGTRETPPAPKATAPAARPAEPDESPQLLTPPGLRLDASVRPVRQAVTLELDPRQETFRGTVDVELSLPEPTRVLWLHGEELEVKGAAFTVGAEREGATVLPLGGMLAVLPRRPLGPGTVFLRMEYTGRAIAREGSGVFREEEAGRWYAMTQFQAQHARRAFPCFDEPSFKIPWQLTLRVPEADAAFSNMPVEAEERGADGWKTVRFRATPPLPTYLVAFAVGP
ncbi:MAG TPA: M1 family peptidase, partial [Myxococcus sp.]|nr:M1 family peptidase [Myxococcus sp.]